MGRTFKARRLACLLVACCLVSGSVLAEGTIHYQRCATENTPQYLRPEIQSRIAMAEIAQAARKSEIGVLDTVSIEVYVHVVTRSDGTTPVTDEQISDQIQVLNDSYASSGFTFNLVGSDVFTGYDEVSDGSDNEYVMKSNLHQGGASTLNLYLVKTGGSILGWATFPWYYADNPTNDGVVILDSSVPGGTASPYNLGITAVHEVGHWLGLYHPWGNVTNGCRGSGDGVKDTPAQKTADFLCKPQDTCKKVAGRDPIRNFMNYTDDNCVTNFSRGQKNRMSAAFSAYRSGN